jgi:hypothetical protein
MQKMAKEIVSIMLDEYGSDEFLKRVSDPFWFQALGCVLGYDWHSSGVTTVLTGILKKAISSQQHGIAICGGKGKASRKTPAEIGEVGEKFGFSDDRIEALRYASKMSAKVDNTAVQAGYQLYHHAFFIADDGDWAVVQQGMCTQDRTARRYHWLSDSVKSYVVEPQTAIAGDMRRGTVLNMTAKQSEGCRKTSVDLAKEEPEKLKRMLQLIRPEFQKSLSEWLFGTVEPTLTKRRFDMLYMPRKINWKTLQDVYDFQPRNYEELLALRGVGPATVRGLALVAEVIYGEKPSWNDPVKYSFAYGGKDGVPFPVDRKAMDESIQILRQAVGEAKIGEPDKKRSLRKLMQFAPNKVPNRKTSSVT